MSHHDLFPFAGSDHAIMQFTIPGRLVEAAQGFAQAFIAQRKGGVMHRNHHLGFQIGKSL